MGIVRGKELKSAVVNQGAAGTTELVAAPGTQTRVYVVSIVLSLSAAGTAKFRSGGADITGAVNVAANGGMSVVGDVDSPVLEGAKGGNLELTTVTGLGKGRVSYYLAP